MTASPSTSSSTSPRHRTVTLPATIALTVLRATGMLSRLGMAYRPFPAGPLTPVEGLQMTGTPLSLTYALAVGHDDPYALADDVLLPFEVVSALGGGRRAASGCALGIEGAEVSAFAAEGEAARGPCLQPDSCHDHGDPARTFGMAGRSAGLPRPTVRRVVRTTALRDRHGPAAQRLTQTADPDGRPRRLTQTADPVAQCGDSRRKTSSHSGRDGRSISDRSASRGEQRPSTMASTCSAMGISTPWPRPAPPGARRSSPLRPPSACH